MRSLFIYLFLLTLYTNSPAQLNIKIDAQKDSFYTDLKVPEEGFLQIGSEDFIPFSGPKPDNDQDLSAKIWLAWDSIYFYIYAEIADDIIKVNNEWSFRNDCIELKFDPNPFLKPLTGVVNARLTALDTNKAETPAGVDNLYSDQYLDSLAANKENYARSLTANGYNVEFRLKWEWIKAEGHTITPAIDEIFGFGLNIHDNDSNQRDGSITWSVGMADEIWNTPQLLGTIQFLPEHRLKLIKKSSIDPNAQAGKTYLSEARFKTSTDGINQTLGIFAYLPSGIKR